MAYMSNCRVSVKLWLLITGFDVLALGGGREI
jgi:hypothetical protein